MLSKVEYIFSETKHNTIKDSFKELNILAGNYYTKKNKDFFQLQY